MKNLTLCPIIVAIFTTLESFVVGSEVLGQNLVTGCWSGQTITIQVRDINSPSTPFMWETFTIVSGVTTCSEADTEVFWWNKCYLRGITSPNQELGCDLVSDDFCCVTLQEIALPSDPFYGDVPFINLGDGYKKYRVIEIRCRP